MYPSLKYFFHMSRLPHKNNGGFDCATTAAASISSFDKGARGRSTRTCSRHHCTDGLPTQSSKSAKKRETSLRCFPLPGSPPSMPSSEILSRSRFRHVSSDAQQSNAARSALVTPAHSILSFSQLATLANHSSAVHWMKV